MNELMNQEIKTVANITPDDVKKYICPLATDKEIYMFLQMCKMANLNPFLRECYLVKYKPDQPASMLTGYESYIKRAERSELYGGLKSWTEGSVAAGDLKGVVEVYRKDWTQPLIHEVFYEEYVQMTMDFTTKQKRPNKLWAEKPRTMIKKVAISQAFRLAFPNEFSGMPHTVEERNDFEPMVEAEEQPKSSKPVLNMPKSGLNDSVNAFKDTSGLPGFVKQGDLPKNGTLDITPSNGPKNGTGSEIPIIGKDHYANLRLTARKQGWDAEDLKKQVTDLGYIYDKDYVPLNALDAEDIEAFFSIKKIDYMAQQEALEK